MVRPISGTQIAGVDVGGQAVAPAGVEGQELPRQLLDWSR
jgi:hypothetical protein